MKKKVNKDLILFIILIPIMLWIAFYISNRTERNLLSYSVENKSEIGCSVFFEALKELNHPVERTVKPLYSFDTRSIQIVVQNGNFDVKSREVKEWVEKGGILIYLNTGAFDLIGYGVAPEIKGSVSLYKYKKGAIIVSDVVNVTNETLINKTSNAYELLQEIDSCSFERIYFNEAHMVSTINQKTLWDFIPTGVKFILYQFFIVILGFFYYKGKGFGKILSFVEEVERSENEYLYSAASLYRQAKCWDIILENFYRSLLKEMNCPQENWLEYWEKEKLPHFNKAKKTYEFMQFSKARPKVKEYIQIITMLEVLKNSLKKRRDSYWKVSKRTQ